MIQTESENILILHEIGNIGAGKGTQKDLLREKLTLPEYREAGIIFGETVMGNFFRGVKYRDPEYRDFRRAISKTSLDLMDNGNVALDEDALTIWDMSYERHLDNGVNVLVADGMPRTINQKLALDQRFEADREDDEKPTPDPYAIVINLADGLVFGRVAARCIKDMYGENNREIRGLSPDEIRAKVLREYPAARDAKKARPDDDPRKINTRISDYTEFTVPVIPYFDKSRTLRVEGNQPVEVIEAQIWNFVEPKLPHHQWVRENGIYHPSHEEYHLWVPRSALRIAR